MYKHLKYNIMTEEDWENVDSDSRNLVRQFISQKSNYHLIAQTKGNKVYDMLIQDTISSDKILLEVKNRNNPHDKFKTMICDYNKKTDTKKYIDRKEADYVYLFSIYTDNILMFADINQGFKDSKYAPNQTAIKGADQYYYQKATLEIPIEKCQKYRFWKNSSGDYEFKKV